ncbi:MAG: hypothetical protein ACI9EF_000947 [Pseudohongiellaceae bacterium]|jgi:hypothetical protein
MSRTRFTSASALRLVVSAGILVAVLVWLGSSGLEAVDLGAGEQLLGRPGVTRFLVGGAQGWSSLSAEVRVPGEAWEFPAGVIGQPALASDGGAMALVPQGLLWLGQDGDVLPGPEMPPAALGDQWELIGLDGSDRPVLACETEAGRRLFVVADEGFGWRELSADQGPAAPPPGAEVLLSTARRALAFRRADCWEAWVFDGNPVRRLRATGCLGASAVFSPEGDALILDGRIDGIYRLELNSGRLVFMATGNLGLSDRVPFSAGFRGDPLLMVAPVRDNEGYLQILQSNLLGGGRFGITTGAVHHYHASSSKNGRYVSYCQATFEEGAQGAIDETLYLFDFEVARAVYKFKRLGGGAFRGPLFVGDGPNWVFIANGRVLLLDPGKH